MLCLSLWNSWEFNWLIVSFCAPTLYEMSHAVCLQARGRSCASRSVQTSVLGRLLTLPLFDLQRMEPSIQITPADCKLCRLDCSVSLIWAYSFIWVKKKRWDSLTLAYSWSVILKQPLLCDFSTRYLKVKATWSWSEQ